MCEHSNVQTQEKAKVRLDDVKILDIDSVGQLWLNDEAIGFPKPTYAGGVKIGCTLVTRAAWQKIKNVMGNI